MSNAKLQKQLVERLQVICDELGLIIGISEGGEVGALIGTESYITSVANIIGQEEYTLEEDYNDALEEILLPQGRKKMTQVSTKKIVKKKVIKKKPKKPQYTCHDSYDWEWINSDEGV